MKGFRRIVSILVALILVCSQLPFGVFASGDNGIEWSKTNLVEGQGDIVLSDPNARWLSKDIVAENTYKIKFDIVASATEGYRLTTLGLRDANCDGSSGLYIVFNAALDQIRIGYEYTTNNSLIAVASPSGVKEAGTYEVEVITYPDAVEVYLGGSLVTFTDMVSGTYQSITQVPTKTFSGSKVGFIAQGTVYDVKVANIAVYGVEGAEESDDSQDAIEWSDNNIVAGQPNLTLDYFWKWMPTQIKADKSYKYSFDIIASDTAGYRFPTVAVRDVSANSDGTDGLYVVFNNLDDQIRIGYEYTTNHSLIAVASDAGFKPAGTYKVDIITTPNAIEVYMNGNLITFTDMVSGTYQPMTQVPTKEFADAKAGFITQGNVLDTQITNIAIFGEAGVDQSGAESNIEWSDTNLVEGQANISLNDYEWDWLPVELEADKSYKYNFDLVLSDTNGYRLPTLAVRDSNEASEGKEGLYVVFYGVEDQIRIGYEATTYSSLIGVAKDVGMDPAGTYAIEVISTPNTIEVSVNGTPITFYDYSDSQMKRAVSVSGIKDGKTGFNAQGTVMDTQVINIALYGEKNPTVPDEPVIDTAAVENVIALIDAIGTVTEDSGSAIADARNAYNVLTDDEKELVTNISTLQEAEAIYVQLTASQDIMLYSLSATDAMGYNHWTQCVGITNVVGGGMKFNWKNAGTNMRQGINRKVKLDGLHAVFSGWEATKGSNAIAIYLADLDSQESYTQILKDSTSYYYPLALILNGVDGTLGIASADDNTYPISVIAKSDSLKYEALAGKEWSMFMDDNGDGSYTVTINGVSGIITKEMFDACNKLTQTKNVYLTICPWDWAGQTTGSLNVLSLHDGNSACANNLTSTEMSEVLALVEKIKTIGIVTVDSLAKIEACEADYVKLSDIQKGCVVNYSTLVAARYRYEQITQEVNEPCLNYYSISTADLAGTNHWPEELFYNDIADGGVKFEWINGGTNIRRLINREVTLDGLHMLFGGLNAENQVKKVALFCADLYDTAADWTSLYSEYVQGEPSILALIFDFSEGTLTAHVEGQSDVVIINDSRITYEYLKDVVWELKVEKNSEGDYVFDVAGATGVLPASLCDAATRLTNPDKSMYITISPWNWKPYNVAIDVLAIHGKSVVCAEELTETQVVELNKVIDTINAIFTQEGKIVPESEEKYIAAWELYDSLATNLQPLVSNYGYLLVAEEVLDVVLAIDSIGTVTYESGEVIELIRQMYKDLAVSVKGNNSTALQRVDIDIDKRVMVGNYDDLQKAISDYYNLRKELDLEGKLPDNNSNTNNNSSNNNGETLSPITGEVISYSTITVMLISIIAIAVVVCRKKFGKES